MLAVCCHGYGRNWSVVADDEVLNGVEFPEDFSLKKFESIMLVTWSTSGTARRSASHVGFCFVWDTATIGRRGEIVGSMRSYRFQTVNCRNSSK